MYTFHANVKKFASIQYDPAGHIRYNLIITTIKFPKGFGAQTCEVRLYYNGISTKKMADFTFFM